MAAIHRLSSTAARSIAWRMIPVPPRGRSFGAEALAEVEDWTEWEEDERERSRGRQVACVYNRRVAKPLDVPGISMGSLVRQELNPNSSLCKKFVAGHSCRKYATSSSSYSTYDGTRDGQQDCKVLDCKNSNAEEPVEKRVGKNISSAEKKKFLINTLLDLKDSKEVVYGTLDAWVAWEHNFPLAALKKALLVLEKEEQWHRVIQVIKWMLSKGQGTTMGTYEQLVRALEKDNRAEEAHRIWMKKISHDLHSVPWRFCDLMLSIYYRNNMLERLIKLFQELEAFDRKPPSKSIVRKVGDAYEILGLLEEKKKLLEKYNHLFSERSNLTSRKSRKSKKVAGKDEKSTENSTQVDCEVSDAEMAYGV